MQRIIVSDASCLILLDKIGELNLLQKIFGQILITETVSNEINITLPDWIEVKNPETNLHFALASILDSGEATSISLAMDYDNALLIIDEFKGRKVAQEMVLKITGTLGVLVIAKEKIITASVKEIITKISSTNFRLSNALVEELLRQAGEH
ncbi:MAG: DUF3368 domain-containing protein [Bacteroidia bacterium]